LYQQFIQYNGDDKLKAQASFAQCYQRADLSVKILSLYGIQAIRLFNFIINTSERVHRLPKLAFHCALGIDVDGEGYWFGIHGLA